MRSSYSLRIARLPGRAATFLVLLASGLAAGNAESQQLNFQHYGAGAGLPQMQVFDVQQDERGYIWVGTYGGVARFNGHEFRNYTTEDGLKSNVVEALAVDGEGQVWAGTGEGLCRLSLRQDRFECGHHPELDGAYVHGIRADGGGLWVATTRGLFRIEDGAVSGHVNSEDGLPVNDVFSAETDARGRLWVGTSEGVLRRSEAGYQPVPLPAEGSLQVMALKAEADQMWIGTDAGLFRHRDGEIEAVDGIPAAARHADINGITRDVHDDLWIATDLGMLRGREGHFRLLDEDSGLANPLSHAVYRDREGLLWIGQDNGLTKWVPRPFSGYTTEHGLISDFVRTINEDHRSRLWLGTRVGIQIVPYKDGDWRFDQGRHITAEDGLLDERVYAIGFVAPGEALIATDRGLVRWREDEGVVEIYTTENGLPSNQTRSVWVDHSGGVWIGTNRGTVFLEDDEIRSAPHPQLAPAYSLRIREDDRDRVWFATRDRGLFILHRGEIRQLQEAEGLTNQTLWDLSPAREDGMWLGSNGDGLFHVRGDGRIEQYTTEDGLADDFVWQVLQDSRGDVWAYTNQGLSRFDGTEFRNYDRDDGLLHEEGGATGAWESHDGDLWFSSAAGLMRYDPEQVYTNSVPPPVVIDSVSLRGEPVSDGASFPHGAGSMDFEFTALSFQSQNAVRYRYRLLGLDEQWSTPVSRRPITFGNLAGGDYVFEVEARNPDGVWSREPARFRFSVTPRFWQTMWFWALALPLGGGLVWGLVRLRLRHSEARRQELEALVAERTRQLECASVTDPLTGLRNRRFLMNQIGTDVAQSQRAYKGKQLYPNRDIVFMMVDLDHFKVINDTYGHLVGDRILQQYAEIIRRQLRESDYVVRWGGEEFLVVARQTEATQLNVIAERMGREARQARFPVDGVEGGLVCTCSIGVSHFPFLRHLPEALTWEQVVDIADTAVYMAKALGRDGWVAIHGLDEETPVEDGMAFVRRIKTDLASLVRAGEVRIESSYEDPMVACPGAKPE